jgi:hypothetical protein
MSIATIGLAAPLTRQRFPQPWTPMLHGLSFARSAERIDTRATSIENAQLIRTRTVFDRSRCTTARE